MRPRPTVQKRFRRIPSFSDGGAPEQPAILKWSSEAAGICKIGVTMRLASKLSIRSKIDKYFCSAGLVALSVFGSACGHRSNSVSGTIEVDEVHVGPRSGGRVEKIFAWEGDVLHAGQPIVQLDASELHARRDLAEAQINTAIHDADSQ